MNLFEELKQLQSIKPDAEFTSSSRGRILGRRITLNHLLLQNTPTAFATLALILLFLFAGTNFLAGSKITAIDPRGLKAEAQAIDIQIQLTNLNYSPASGNETTPSTAQNTKISASTSKTSNDSIDDALKALSQ